MVTVDRRKLADKVVGALIGSTNGEHIVAHKMRIVTTIVVQVIDVLGEMGYLNLKGVMDGEQKEVKQVSEGKNKKSGK